MFYGKFIKYSTNKICLANFMLDFRPLECIIIFHNQNFDAIAAICCTIFHSSGILENYCSARDRNIYAYTYSQAKTHNINLNRARTYRMNLFNAKSSYNIITYRGNVQHIVKEKNNNYEMNNLNSMTVALRG